MCKFSREWKLVSSTSEYRSFQSCATIHSHVLHMARYEAVSNGIIIGAGPILNNVTRPALPRATVQVGGGLGDRDVSPRDDLR